MEYSERYPTRSLDLLHSVETLASAANTLGTDPLLKESHAIIAELCMALAIHAKLILDANFATSTISELSAFRDLAKSLVDSLNTFSHIKGADSVANLKGKGSRPGITPESVQIFSENYRSFMAKAIGVIAARNNMMYGGMTADAITHIKQMEADIEKHLAESTIARENIDTLLAQSTQDAAATNAIAKQRILETYGSDFQKSAASHRNWSYLWLVMTAALIIAILCLGANTYTSEKELFQANGLKVGANSNLGLQVVAFLATRLIMASAIFVALNLTIKNYKISKHNELAQEHRQLALSTFEIFMRESSEDSATKNAVLLEVCRTIFSLQASGYTGSDNDVEGPSKIIEIIKSFPGK